MSPTRSNHRRNHTISNSIPLRDLNRPPEEDDDGEDIFQERTHRRTLSDRGRALFTRSPRIAGGGGAGDYGLLNALNEETAYQPHRAGQQPRPFQTRSGRAAAGSGDDDHSPFPGPRTPMIPFSSGITLQQSAPDSPLASRGLHLHIGREDSLSSVSVDFDDEDQGDQSQWNADTLHLTDSRYLQPMASNAPPSTPPGRRQPSIDRDNASSGGRPSPSSARLGDDLVASRSRPRSRAYSGSSLSPSVLESPLQRASTIMRKMSARVVNLSNESEVVRHELHGRLSQSSDIRPTIPELAEPATDLPVEHRLPSMEKPSIDILADPDMQEPSLLKNPFKGKSVGTFSPNSKIRLWCCDLLVHPWTEPAILLLIVAQTVLLAVDSAPNVVNDPRSQRWGTTWVDYALLAIFVIYSAEIVVRVVVSGLIINPVEYSTIDRGDGFREALLARLSTLFSLRHEIPDLEKDSVRKAEYADMIQSLQSSSSHGATRDLQRLRLAHRAFLRHSFNRIHFLTVVSFWISFALGLAGLEYKNHVWIFRMLSCLRILNLLSITSGTSIILRSLKKAAPLLLNVALLIGFFWLLFAIIGVQSFKSSLSRYCVWQDPAGIQANYTLNAYGAYQFCGGSLDADGSRMPYLLSDGVTSSNVTKGYLCPVNSVCVVSQSPYNGTVNFDNLFNALELIFVIMSSNTYTDLMYYLTDSDYLIVAIFFAAGIIVFTFWLVNLLVAVITSSFAVIRDESHVSAFAAQPTDSQSGSYVQASPTAPLRKSSIKRFYDKTAWLWILVISYGLICQCLRSASMSNARRDFIELVVTLLLLFEICFRFIADRRAFIKSRQNWIDVGLAVITSIIQIPVIRNSGQPYAWLTLFQLLRVYRVVLAISWTRELILLILGGATGILNLVFFLFLLTFLVSIFASQLFREELPVLDSNGNYIEVTFGSIYNCFLGMYQVLSSENWTILMYNITAYDVDSNTAWIGAIFFISWFILGFFIILNMFIAVIQENFDVSEDEKRLQQVKAFLQHKELGTSSNGTLSLTSMFTFRSIYGQRQDPLDYGSAMLEMLLKEAVVKDFLDEGQDRSQPATDRLSTRSASRPSSLLNGSSILELPKGVFASLRRPIEKWLAREPNPFYSSTISSNANEDVDPRTMAKAALAAAERRKRAQRDYLVRHPTYNVSMFLFPPRSPIRTICQKMVGPSRGHERIEGAAPSPRVWYVFSAFLYAAIIAMVLLACITTPLYQRQYFAQHEYSVRNWFVWADLAFAIIFTLEAMIRLIADGFFFTPNAYFRSSWGIIDGIVLVTLWINIVTSLYNDGAVSRAVGAFKALRALRLLNISDTARETFHAVIVRGGLKVISAAFVSLSLLIPFAIYGINLFAGQMQGCNDTASGISNLSDCTGEYLSSPYNWNVLAPRVVSNPYFSFDNFGSSLFILFQIVSQEGWVDVMWRAESITGIFSQPQPFSRQGNTVFFIVFNLLGSVFVLTLFVSVFMRNYTEQTGVAFLTTEQRAWLELRKILRQVAPSKRPPHDAKRENWQQWCYRRAVHKTGRWQRFVTSSLLFQLVLLCLEFYPEVAWWERTRTYIFMVMTVFYVFTIAVRIIGLTWTRFRKSAWNLFAVFIVGGSFITAILLFCNFGNRAYTQIHKLFLVGTVLLLIPRNNQLDQLFKTAAASLPAIGTLLATWSVLFLVFAIAMTQTFGLTRFSSNETGNINLRSVPKALILLFRMSTGEGWNQIMTDFATVLPPYCTEGAFLDSDCGSTAWARVLFVAWNILSMYIFVNLFVSLIYESFAYVYQRSSGLSIISRDEIRRFKQAWAKFDPNGTGFISKADFPRFLSNLSGALEMSIYSGSEFSVRNFINDCKGKNNYSQEPHSGNYQNLKIDLKKLNEKLSYLPVEEVRQRRIRRNMFCEEVLVSADPDRGIAFTALLMILAQHKVINDNKSLRLEEFLRRRARLQRVEEAVRRNIVVGFFDTLYYTRRFRRNRAARLALEPSSRHAGISQLQMPVPEIIVEDDDEAREAERRGSAINLPGSETKTQPKRPVLAIHIPEVRITEGSIASGSDSAHHEGAALRSRSNSVQRMSRMRSPSPASAQQLSPLRRSTSIDARRSPRERLPNLDGSSGANLSAPCSPLTPEAGRPSAESWTRRSSAEDGSLDVGRERARAVSNVSIGAQDMLQTFDESAWGASIKRSKTLRRANSNE